MGWPALGGAVIGSATGTWVGVRIVPLDRIALSWAAGILGGAAGVILSILLLASMGAVELGQRKGSLGIFGAIVGSGVRMIIRGRRSPTNAGPVTNLS